MKNVAPFRIAIISIVSHNRTNLKITPDRKFMDSLHKHINFGTN